MTRHNVATVAVDSSAVSPSRALAVVARLHDRLVCVTSRAYAELVAELGSDEAAVRHLLKVAGTAGRPIAVNLPAPDGSTTVFIAPRGWTDGRLRGWAAGHVEDLAEMFGPASVRPREDV